MLSRVSDGCERRLSRSILVTALILLQFVVGPAQLAPACLWTYTTDVHGHTKETIDWSPEYHPILDAIKNKPSPSEIAAKVQHWRDGPLPDGFQEQNDFAVALIRAGEFDPALKLLLNIEQVLPGEYIVAANLGTCYELNGDVPKALEWIRKGVERNPDSHYGTEWLHVKILEAKQEFAKQPDWLTNNSVLGMNFGSEVVPVPSTDELVVYGNRKMDLESVKDALVYQLRERLAFVGPPDPIVADLMEALANLYAIQEGLEAAIPVYELALEYRSPHARLINARLAHFRKLVAANPDSGQPANPARRETIAATFVCLAAC